MFSFIKNITPVELGVIALIVIILFGSKIVIGIARAGGDTVKQIKKIKENITQAVEGEPKS